MKKWLFVILFLTVMCQITHAENVFVANYPYFNATELVIGQSLTATLGQFGEWRQGFSGVDTITLQTQQQLYVFDNLPQPFLISVWTGNPYEVVTVTCIPEPASVLLFGVGALLLRARKQP